MGTFNTERNRPEGDRLPAKLAIVEIRNLLYSKT
jgi:hypothetical protein